MILCIYSCIIFLKSVDRVASNSIRSWVLAVSHFVAVFLPFPNEMIISVCCEQTIIYYSTCNHSASFLTSSSLLKKSPQIFDFQRYLGSSIHAQTLLHLFSRRIFSDLYSITYATGYFSFIAHILSYLVPLQPGAVLVITFPISGTLFQFYASNSVHQLRA